MATVPILSPLAMNAAASLWQTVVDFPFGLGESPFWRGMEDRLYWLDIPGGQFLRLHVPSGTLERWDLPDQPGCAAPTRTGGFVIATRHGIQRAHGWGMPLQEMVPAPYDTTRIRFNDGKCDPWGRFWAGTYVDARDRPDGALYCLQPMFQRRPDQREFHADFRLMESGVTAANGLAWSPDGRTVYWADTLAHTIRSYALKGQGKDIELASPQVFARFPPKPDGWTFDSTLGQGYGGRPDGAAVDSRGRYWVAMYEGARVVCLDPQGHLVAEYPTPVQCPTMVCFGGPDLRTLYLTSASANRSPAELAHHPLSGGVFSMRVDVPGLPVNVYQD